MKQAILTCTLALAAGSLFAADATPKDDITSAAKKLADKGSYSWTSTVVVPEDAQFKPGPTSGKTEKDGYTDVSLATFGDNKMEVVMKGTNMTFSGQDGWQKPSDVEKAEGFGRFAGMMASSIRLPAAEAMELIGDAKEIKKDGDVYAANMSTEEAASILRLRGPKEGGAEVANPKGSMKFWIKEGVLTKYEFKVAGKVNWGGNEFDTDRTTTVEIKDAGSTKVTPPADALKKLP